MKINPNLYEKNASGIYQLKDGIAPPTGEVLLLLQDIQTGKVIEELYKNLFVTAGKNSLAQRNVGQATGIMTYCALGTGTNVPSAGDTKLQTEVIRKLISLRTVSGAVATLQTFYNTTEGNAALKEAGLFGDTADGTVDSGTLFARTAINRTKNSTQTLTIAWAVTHN